MKWYLASYPSYCYLTLRRIKFQQFFICALCHVYFKNPSWKCKIISGGKHVIYLNADGAGTEQPVSEGSLTSQLVPRGDAGVAGHGCASVPLRTLPRTCQHHIPAPCPSHPSSALALQLAKVFHTSIKQRAWCSACSSPRSQSACLQFEVKMVVWG